MKSFFRTVLYALILLIVGLVSALTAMRFAIHGREVTVPKLVGLTPAEAQRLAASNGLLLWREEHFYSSDVPEGRILSQLPVEGTRVRAGFRIRVAQSLGPQKVVIPDLVGDSARAAEINLRRRGLELGSMAVLPTAASAPDLVIAQSPPPDARGVSSPTVSLLMSAPMTPEFLVMPNFIGTRISDATTAVRNAGLVVGTISTAAPAPAVSASGAVAGAQTGVIPSPNAQPSPSQVRTPGEQTVTHQTPSPGQRVLPSMSVHFEVTR